MIYKDANGERLKEGDRMYVVFGIPPTRAKGVIKKHHGQLYFFPDNKYQPISPMVVMKSKFQEYIFKENEDAT